MRKWILSALLALLPISAWAQGNFSATGNITTSASTCTAGVCVQLQSNQNYGGLAVQVSGSFMGTLQFEGSSNGATFVAMTGINPADGTTATSTTAAGVWQFPTSGLSYFRVRGSAWTSGTALIVMQSGSATAKFRSTTGPGSGTVTSIGTTTPITGGTITTTGTIACPTCVVGPAGASADHLAVFNGTTGYLIKDGGAIPSASLASTYVGVGSISNVLTGSSALTFAANLLTTPSLNLSSVVAPKSLLVNSSGNVQPHQTFNVKAYGATGNAKMVTDAVFTNGSTTVTCADCNFTSADLGKVVWGTGSGFIHLPKGTIAVVTNSTTITVSVAALADGTGRYMAWGTDDTAALQSASAAASLAHGTIYVPTGGYIFSSLPFNFNAVDPAPGIVGDGPTATVFYPTTDYDFSSTSTQNGMLVRYVNATHGRLSNFSINGVGYNRYGQSNYFALMLGSNFGVNENVTVQNIGGVGACMAYIGNHTDNYAMHVTECGNANSNTSIYGLYVSGGQNTFHGTTIANSATGVPMVLLYQVGKAVTDNYFRCFGCFFDEGSSSGQSNISVVDSPGDILFSGIMSYVGASQVALTVDGTSTNVKIRDSTLGNPGEQSAMTALKVLSGGIAYVSNSVLNTAGGGFSINNAGTVYDMGGNTVTNTTGAGGLVLLKTAFNCSDGAGAAACGAAAAGSVVIDAGATSVTVSSTSVTANSQILITEDSSLGTKLGAITCNTALGRNYSITARTAATSFVITTDATPVTNPSCLSYLVIN